MAVPASSPDPERVAGLYPETVARLRELLGPHYSALREADARLQEATSRENAPGGRVESIVLAQLGNLLSGADTLSEDEQLGRVNDLKRQLARGTGRSWQDLLTMRLGEVDELWDKYETLAQALHENEQLTGWPSHRELDRLRRNCQNSFELGQAALALDDWEHLQSGATHYLAAAETATALLEGLEQAISAANHHRSERRHRRVSRRLTIIAIVIAMTVPIGMRLVFPAETAGPARTVTIHAPPPDRP